MKIDLGNSNHYYQVIANLSKEYTLMSLPINQAVIYSSPKSN